MAVVTFYEKPGCSGNARQKTAARCSRPHRPGQEPARPRRGRPTGCSPSSASCRSAQWFNPAAPAIKSGEIVPENIDFEHALWLLLANPLLIRRPLMEVGDERRVGFDVAAVDAWIGLKNVELPEGNVEACVHGPEGHGSCGSHAHDHEEEDSSHGRCGHH